MWRRIFKDNWIAQEKGRRISCSNLGAWRYLREAERIRLDWYRRMLWNVVIIDLLSRAIQRLLRGDAQRRDKSWKSWWKIQQSFNEEDSRTITFPNEKEQNDADVYGIKNTLWRTKALENFLSLLETISCVLKVIENEEGR